MPFTASHPAIVVPLMRTGLVPSALVIGSMVPDAPLFFPLPFGYHETHANVGIVGIDLIAGLVAFGLWQGLIAPAVVAAAPAGLRARLAPRLPRSLRWHLASTRRLVALVASLWIGAASHVSWDSFTHGGRWGVRQIGWLGETHWGLTGHGWAQYGSGVIGGVAILLAAGRWWRRTAPADPVTQPQRVPPLERVAAQRGAAIVLGAALAAARLGLVAGVVGTQGLASTIYLMVTWGGAVGLIAAVAYAGVLRARGALG